MDQAVKPRARNILAGNLKTLMKRNLNLKTQVKLAKRSGVAQTTISNMLNPGTSAMASPKLDSVEKVAQAFGLATWQLLLDPTVGQELSGLLMRPAIEVSWTPEKHPTR
jgi:transcriptional regulator with XRE-family HTH domain